MYFHRQAQFDASRRGKKRAEVLLAIKMKLSYRIGEGGRGEREKSLLISDPTGSELCLGREKEKGKNVRRQRAKTIHRMNDKKATTRYL